VWREGKQEVERVAVAERRPGVTHCTGGRENKAGQHVPEEEEEREEVQRTYVQN
jgi:hypothetical protein